MHLPAISVTIFLNMPIVKEYLNDSYYFALEFLLYTIMSNAIPLQYKVKNSKNEGYMPNV